MIDHLIRFASEAEAKADPVCGAYYVNGSWRGDVCIADQKVIKRSTGELLDGWYIRVALPALDAKLSSHPNCAFIFDRDAASRGRPFVKMSAYASVDFADLLFSPTFAGDTAPQRMNTAPPAIAAAQTKQDWAATVLTADAIVQSKPVTVVPGSAPPVVTKAQ